MGGFNDSFGRLLEDVRKASAAFDKFVYSLGLYNSPRSNNWLKMHGYPMRRKVAMVVYENLKRLIKRRAIKKNITTEGYVMYGGVLYYVNFQKDVVNMTGVGRRQCWWKL